MAKTTQYIDSDFTSIKFTPKRQNLYFRADGLKPKTNTNITVNDVEIEQFTLVTDVIQIEFDDNDSGKKRKNWNSNFRQGSSFTIVEPVLGSSSSRKIARGKLDYLEIISYNANTKTGIANVHLYVDGSGTDTLDSNYRKIWQERVVTSNATFLTESSIGTANNKIIAYYPKFSAINVATSNTIQLIGKVANSEIANANSSHYIVGKTIHIISGEGAGQNAVVASYNTQTLTITTTEDFDIIPGAIANTQISRDDRAIVRLDELYSDSKGILTGVISIPSLIENDVIEGNYGWRYYKRWNGWKRRFRFYRKNKFEFSSVEFANTTVTDVVPVEPVPKDPEPRGNTDSSGGSTLTPTTFSVTPFAQTFYVDDKIHPQGISLTSVRLLLRSKDDEYPLQVQIRPTTASIPDPATVIPNGNAFIDPVDINLLTEDALKLLNINNTNPFSNTSYYSEATFQKPVFLEPGKEYALVIMSPSSKHELYLSQIGQKLLGTDRVISTQPYLGVLYKSQGTSEWTPSPNEDLAFELMKARYDTTTPAVVDFYLKSLPQDIDNYGMPGIISLENTAPLENVNVHAFYIDSPDNILPNTKIDYQFRSTRDGGARDDFKNVELETTYEFKDSYGTRVLTSNNDSFVLRASIYTTNPDVAPVVDFTGINLVKIENVIDNNSLANSDFFITNLGQDYSNSQNVIVTISGGGGSGATAKANVLNGQVVAIEVINGGSGYTGSPNVIISKDTTATINAQAVVIGEDQPNGGVGNAKYITRKFTLADGFNAGDLRVLFSAVKFRESEVDVYYKVLSEDDADSFDNKRWTQMTLIGGINAYSVNDKDYKKYIYAPGTGNIADNFINYDGFTTFKYFAIKLVMRSTDGTKVPRIKEFRVTALAELLT